ncbi:MAG: cell division protein ZapA [Prevotellaceae bacterium]|jgi:cell division protein ZapA|nr:cell division protein ZapA [Prevotellaceae bacterium]
MEEETLSIKINVADRYYPFKITTSGEESLRAAARRINEVVAQYRQRYSDRDMYDALAMAALQFVVKLIGYEATQGRMINEVAVLDEELEEYLQAIE